MGSTNLPETAHMISKDTRDTYYHNKSPCHQPGASEQTWEPPSFLWLLKCLEVLKLVHDLVEKVAEIKQLSVSRLLSYWKRRITTTLQRENTLFILNSSAHVLSATNRFDPECEPHLDEVLNQESIHCSYNV